MLKIGLGGRLQFGNDMLGKLLAKLDAPLVERIDSPDGTLREDGVLVESHEGPKRARIEFVGHDDIRGAVPLEDTVRVEPIGRPLRLHLLRRLAEGQRLGLGKDI